MGIARRAARESGNHRDRERSTHSCKRSTVQWFTLTAMADMDVSASERFAPKRVQIRGYSKLTHLVFCAGALLWLLHDLVKANFNPGLVVVPMVAAFAVEKLARRKRRPDALTVQRDHLVLHRGTRRTRFRLADAPEGWLESSKSATATCLKTTTGLTVVAWFKDEQSARSLLTIAGVDAERRVVEWQLVRDNALFTLASVAVVIGGLVFLHPSRGYSGAAWWLPSALASFAAWVFRLGYVRVGVDGLLFGSALRRRFVSYRDVVDVFRDTSGEYVRVRLRSGKVWSFAPAHVGESDKAVRSKSRAEDLRALIQWHVERMRDDEAESLHCALERRNQSLSDWRQRLQQLIHGGYRTHAVTPTELAEILDNSAATSEQRLGAALALAESRDPMARQRIRVAVDRCAEPKLRIALEHVAAGELDEIDALTIPPAPSTTLTFKD